jgi:hypothetical protein
VWSSSIGEAELAKANLLWTLAQLVEARGRSDFLGFGEGGLSSPSRYCVCGLTTNAQVVPSALSACHFPNQAQLIKSISDFAGVGIWRRRSSSS